MLSPRELTIFTFQNNIFFILIDYLFIIFEDFCHFQANNIKYMFWKRGFFPQIFRIRFSLKFQNQIQFNYNLNLDEIIRYLNKISCGKENCDILSFSKIKITLNIVEIGEFVLSSICIRSRKHIGIVIIFYFRLLMYSHVLGCLEYNLTLFIKYLAIILCVT